MHMLVQILLVIFVIFAQSFKDTVDVLDHFSEVVGLEWLHLHAVPV